jgi:high affinity choline transporter 7
MQIHVLGVAAIVFFYVLILAVGIWAGRKSKGQTNSEEVMLAGRNIGLIVGVFTMTGELVDRLTS